MIIVWRTVGEARPGGLYFLLTLLPINRRMYWADFNQIFRLGRHVDETNESDIRFAIARGTSSALALLTIIRCINVPT